MNKPCILCNDHKTVYDPDGEEMPCPCTISDTVEVVGPDGKVHYRRPVCHEDLLELENAPGYTVRPYIA